MGTHAVSREPLLTVLEDVGSSTFDREEESRLQEKVASVRSFLGESIVRCLEPGPANSVSAMFREIHGNVTAVEALLIAGSLMQISQKRDCTTCSNKDCEMREPTTSKSSADEEPTLIQVEL